jgi:hypothetical protein
VPSRTGPVARSEARRARRALPGGSGVRRYVSAELACVDAERERQRGLIACSVPLGSMVRPPQASQQEPTSSDRAVWVTRSLDTSRTVTGTLAALELLSKRALPRRTAGRIHALVAPIPLLDR